MRTAAMTPPPTKKKPLKGKTFAEIICTHANSSALRAAKMGEDYMSFLRNEFTLRTKKKIKSERQRLREKTGKNSRRKT